MTYSITKRFAGRASYQFTEDGSAIFGKHIPADDINAFFQRLNRALKGVDAENIFLNLTVSNLQLKSRKGPKDIKRIVSVIFDREPVATLTQNFLPADNPDAFYAISKTNWIFYSKEDEFKEDYRIPSNLFIDAKIDKALESGCISDEITVEFNVYLQYIASTPIMLP